MTIGDLMGRDCSASTSGSYVSFMCSERFVPIYRAWIATILPARVHCLPDQSLPCGIAILTALSCVECRLFARSRGWVRECNTKYWVWLSISTVVQRRCSFQSYVWVNVLRKWINTRESHTVGIPAFHCCPIPQLGAARNHAGFVSRTCKESIHCCPMPWLGFIQDRTTLYRSNFYILIYTHGRRRLQRPVKRCKGRASAKRDYRHAHAPYYIFPWDSSTEKHGYRCSMTEWQIKQATYHTSNISYKQQIIQATHK